MMISPAAALSPLPALCIGEYTIPVPIIQGGMGVRVSAHRLAGAVANEGGVGIVATVALSLASKYYKKGKDYYHANIKALIDELRLARELSPRGIIGTNCMVAIRDFEAMVRTSVEHGAHMIIAGAGLPLRLPELAASNPHTALIPIVSSLRAARLLTQRWRKLYKRIPDAILFEDPNSAGGHLGVRRNHLYSDAFGSERAVPELAEWSHTQYSNEIPIVVAGGIWDRKDIDHAFTLGAKGVQMASRFLCTYECDAHERYKQAFIDAKASDVVIIDSPAGLPGRALNTPFTRALFRGGEVASRCIASCLESCSCRAEKEAFCIAEALHRAQQGDLERGLIFTGTNGVRHTHMSHVRDIFQELTTGQSATPDP